MANVMDEKADITYGTIPMGDHGDEQDKVSMKRNDLSHPIFLILPFLALIIGSYYVLQIITVIPSSFLTIEQRANKILTEHPLIDGHNDLLIFLLQATGNHIYGKDFKTKFEGGGFDKHVDIPRLDQGKSGGAFWSAFVPCPTRAWDFSDENYSPSVRLTLEQFDLFHRLSAEYPRYFTPTPNHAAALHAFQNHRLISPLAIEGLHQIGNSLSTLRLYHALGARYATLTWNCHNKFADAALVPDPDTGSFYTAKRPLWHGLSDAGREIVHEMNRLGMMVDLSHVSADTMRDVLQGAPTPDPSDPTKFWNASIAPPIFSHSSAYAICPHPRNVPDDVLALVAQRRSLVMVNFSPDFVACEPGPDTPETGIPATVPERATLAEVVRHIRYIGEKIGYDYVGIGSDFDGIEQTPKGLEDVGRFPALVVEMLKQGVSEADAAKVVGRNLLRVWKEVDGVAEELQKTLKPAEDELKWG